MELLERFWRLIEGRDSMNHKQKKYEKFGRGMTAKWLSVPKPIRYLVVYTGLVLLVYFANKAIWF